MTFVPKILNYKPIYIQANGDELATDTMKWGLVAKSNPFPVLPSPKGVYKNEWKDENGDDEYVDKMYFSSISFSISFYLKAFATDGKSATETMLSQIDLFFDKIKQGEFMIYDSYTGIGYRHVRYESYKEERFKAKGEWARSIFTITFKVNDPVTRMTLGKDGKIIEVQR